MECLKAIYGLVKKPLFDPCKNCMINMICSKKCALKYAFEINNVKDNGHEIIKIKFKNIKKISRVDKMRSQKCY